MKNRPDKLREVQPRSSIDARVTLPGSKSLTHRALIAAGLAQGRSRLEAFLDSEDTLYTAAALRELGAGISIHGQSARVLGTGGQFHPTEARKEIFLGNSGTSYRLLLSTVALARGEYILTGTPRMHERPIGDLLRALNRLGVEASCMERDEFPPVLIRARGIKGGEAGIDGGKSSQYLSSLLLSAPYAEKDVEIEVRGPLVSRPYVDLTIEVMEAFGIGVDREGYRYFKAAAGQKYSPRKYRIEGDASTASYFWAAAAVTEGSITTENIHPFTTRQGDIALLDVMEQMGCRVDKGRDRVTVRGDALRGIEVDMAAMPDMVPTLAAVALFAKGKTIIRNVSHLRHKESDRLRAIVSEWSRMGGRVTELPDGLVIHGGRPLSGTMVDPHNDHRMAMSLAVVGLRVPGTRVRQPGCVSKSFPGFWHLWDQL